MAEQDPTDYGVPKNVPVNDDIGKYCKIISMKDQFPVLVLSGHEDFQSLFATNDQVTPSFIVNRLGAPNQSTVMVRTNI